MDMHDSCGAELEAVSTGAMSYGPGSSTRREGPSRGGSGALDGRACRCGHGGIAQSDEPSPTVLRTVEHDHPCYLDTQRRNYQFINMQRNKPPDIRTTSMGIDPRRVTRISWIIILFCVASWPLATEGLFVNVQESVNASAGEPTTIPCSYTDDKQETSTLSVRWTRILGNGPTEVLLTKTGSSIEGKWYEEERATVVDQAALRIFIVSSQDAGKYTCTIGGTPGTTELFVDSTPTIQPELRELVLTVGQMLELTCIGAGTLTWSWPQHDEQSITFSRFYDPSSGWQTSELRIRQASVSDTGEYRCISDDRWPSEPVYVYVTREDGPLFLDAEQTDLVHFWDEPSLIPCRLAMPNATVTLQPQEMFDPEVMTYDPRRGFALQARMPDYSGNVSCRATIGNLTDTQNFTVNYVVKPKLSVESPEETILEHGELELICSGSLPIQWFTPSGLDARLQIVHSLSYAPSQPPTYQSTLRLADTLYTDTDEYACKYDRYMEFEQPELESSVYVFVKSNDVEHFFLPPHDNIVHLKTGVESFTVPCRVSDPNTTQPVTISAYFTETIIEFQNFITDWNVNFDPKVGFQVSPNPDTQPIQKLTVFCNAEFEDGTQDVAFKVVVEGALENYFQTKIEPSASRLVQGMGSYSFACTVSIPFFEYPSWTLDYKPQVEFTFPNQEQDKAQNNTKVRETQEIIPPNVIFGSELTLSQVSLRNNGTFKCRIFNIERTVTLNTSLLVLEEGIVELMHYPPDQETVEAVEGQSQVCLQAQMMSFPVAQYWWSKNGVNQTNEAAPRFTALEESQPVGDTLLVSGCISNLTVDDGGSYDVIAANEYHTRTLTIQLSVLEIPEVSLTVSPDPIYQDPPLYYTEQNYSLVCRARGRPAPVLTWQWQACPDPLCNSTALQTDEIPWVPVETQSWAQARFQPTSKSNWSSESVLSVWMPPRSGVFRCVGRSPSNRIQDVAYDVLEYRLTDLRFSLHAAPELKPVYTFDQASLVCKTNIYAFTEDVTWDWTRASNSSAEPIPIGPDDERVTRLGRTGYHYSTELTISAALANNMGLYRCTAKKRSTGESVVVYQVQLIVKEIVPPTFTKELQPTYELDKKKQVPYDFVLECVATGDPLPDEVDWSKDGHPITAQNGSVADLETFRAMNDTLVSTLFLAPEITPAHGGMYECFVKNNGGNVSSQGQVLLQESPTAVISEDVYTRNVGDNLTIPCDTTGEPSPDIVWKKLPRGTSEQEDVPTRLYDNSAKALVFKRLQETDNGEYTCIAQNQHGQDQDTVTLVIHRENSYLMPLLAGGSIALIIFLILLILMIVMAKRNCRLARKAKRNSEGMELGLVNPRSPRVPMSPFRMSFKEEFGDQLPFDSKWEFPRDRLKLGSVIGQGAFGMVLKGVAAGINKNEKYVPVAVKTVKSDASYVDRKALFGELKMLIQVGHHLNVVNFLGACTQDSPPLVIVEFCPYGNLSDYLKSKRDTFQPTKSPAVKSEQEENTENELNYADLCLREACVSEPPAAEYELIDKEAKRMAEKCLSVEDLVCFCFQVARGMEFLASRKCIHRDMAARNVLLGGNNVVKICDFGLSRSFYHDTDYIGSGKGLLPIKWMAPEAIFDKIFTTYSDIWSFGVFTWEVFSLGGSPYPGIQVDEKFYDKMKSGYRMSCPEHAPREVYQLMLECWSDEPKDRPMFSELAEQFGEQLESNTRQEYIDLNIPYQEGQYCELDFGKLSINKKQDTVAEETETMQPSSDDKTTDDAAVDHFHDPAYHKGPKNDTPGPADENVPTNSYQPPPLPENREGGSRPSSSEIVGETCPLHKYAAIPETPETQENLEGSPKPKVPLLDSLPEDPYRRGTDEQLHTYTSLRGARPGTLSTDYPPANGVVAGSNESKVDNLPSPDDSNKLHMYASIKGSRPDTLSPTDPEKGLDRNHLYSSIKGSRPNTTPDVTPEVKGKDFDLPEEELSLLGGPKLPERDFQSMSLGRSLDGRFRAQKPLLPKRDFSTTSWSPETETLLSGPKSQDADAQLQPVYV
ncbi:vascular endothelial growth factor receptor 1-like [Patiria miniata]|uniref:Receptor protein-tyrosine kinase n=1 Tax=Patiria miniata TaxID=46514 RepID=A0A913YZH3_PATMI|nr:vascular endothelial growth factor receptor 1-like [Patiria miniata]